MALLNHAQQLEQQKNWSDAVKEYAKLGSLRGAIAKQSRNQATRLNNLIDQEDSLYAEAQRNESMNNRSRAEQLYLETASLHGDKETEALDAAARINAVENASTHLKGPAVPAHEQPARPSAPPLPSSKFKPQSCQLLQSDYVETLERADSNRAKGKYGDAKREYGEVLACDPGNERAREGLDRTKAAETTPN